MSDSPDFKAWVRPMIRLHGSSAVPLARRLARDYGWSHAYVQFERLYPGYGGEFVSDLQRLGMEPA